jgi:hypothetical protein
MTPNKPKKNHALSRFSRYHPQKPVFEKPRIGGKFFDKLIMTPAGY